MKNLLFLFLLPILITSCFPQPIPVKDYEKIIEIEGLSKDQLYIKTNEWFVEAFNSAESVIEFQDKEAGKIIGKYVVQITQGLYFYNIKQTISIDVKDNKVRMVVKDPYEKATGSTLGGAQYNNNYSPLSSQKRLSTIRLEWDLLSESLTQRLSEKTDW